MPLLSNVDWGKVFKTTAIIYLSFQAGAVWTNLHAENEYERVTSPDGRYTAVVTYPNWATSMVFTPGHSSDKPGFITIYGTDQTNYGKIPIPMLFFIHDLRWEKNGASLTGIGEWNFKEWEYWYWNEDQDKKIYGSAR